MNESINYTTNNASYFDYLGNQNQRWSSAAENSCPDILKNGHNYVKVSKVIHNSETH